MTVKVIGAGFGRTGTLSMKAALEQLGFPCYHMVECLPRGPEHWKLWEDASNGNPDWDTTFAGFTATVDFPACTSYQALADYYPEAKVILTLRDPERWYQSTQDTIFAPHWMEYLKTSELAAYMHGTINAYFDDRMHDKDYLIQRFHEHTAAVQASIPSARLLTFEVQDGWAPLCDFLGLPVPEGEFPHVNDSEATRNIINKMITEGPASALGYDG